MYLRLRNHYRKYNLPLTCPSALRSKPVFAESISILGLRIGFALRITLLVRRAIQETGKRHSICTFGLPICPTPVRDKFVFAEYASWIRNGTRALNGLLCGHNVTLRMRNCRCTSTRAVFSRKCNVSATPESLQRI